MGSRPSLHSSNPDPLMSALCAALAAVCVAAFHSLPIHTDRPPVRKCMAGRSTVSIEERPVYVRFGSKADIAASPTNVRFTPKSGHRNSAAKCPLCAKSGHHSMIVSARAMRVGGTAIPSFLAVFWLIISSNVVGCCIGRSEGLAPFKILSI